MRKPSLLSVAIGCLLSWAAAGAGAQESDQSLLLVTLRLQKGFLAVDRAQSQLRPTGEFRTALFERSEKQIETELFDQLDDFLADRGKPYELALGPADRELDKKDLLSDEQTRELSGLTADWAAARTEFDEWAAGGDGRLTLTAVVQDELVEDDTELSQSTSLFALDRSQLPGLVPKLGADLVRKIARGTEQGFLAFRVADPMGAGSAAFQVAYLNHTTGETAALPPAVIERLLAPLRGRPWLQPGIRSRILHTYGKLGFDPFVRVSRAGERPRRIAIRESHRIARILVPEAEAGEKSFTAKILYYLLEHRHYKRLLDESPDLDQRLPLTAAGLRVFDYAETLGLQPGTEPYLDTLRLGSQIEALGAIGFAVSAVPNVERMQGGEGFSYRDLQVQRFTPEEASADEEGQPAMEPSPGEDAPAEETSSEDAVPSAAERELVELSRRKAKRRTIGGAASGGPIRASDISVSSECVR